MQIADLIPDKRNANKGTVRGAGAVERSLRDFGAGRSILVDRNGNVLAGNQTVKAASSAGIAQDVILVESDGSQLVVVKRTDLDAGDSKARALAVADNRTSELGLEWDPANLAELATDLDLKPFFTDAELADIVGEKESRSDPNAEWNGMPEFTNSDVSGVKHLMIHFKTPEAVREFAELIQQKITDSTKYIWYPEEKPMDAASYKYVE